MTLFNAKKIRKEIVKKFPECKEQMKEYKKMIERQFLVATICWFCLGIGAGYLLFY